MIRVIDYINSGYSEEDATTLIPVIDKALETDLLVSVDFTGVQYFTTLFFSLSLTRLIGELGEEGYRSRISVENLSDSGKETYEHAFEYAIEYFNKTAREQEKERQIVIESLEDQ